MPLYDYVFLLPEGGSYIGTTGSSELKDRLPDPNLDWNQLSPCGIGTFLGDLRIDACGSYNGNLNVAGITTSLIFDASGTSSSTDSTTDDFVVDSSQVKYHHHKASFSGTKKFQISNLTDGRSTYLYLSNTSGFERTMIIEASTTTSGFSTVPLSQSGFYSVGVTTLTSYNGTVGGTATVWVVNIDGNISGALY